MREPTWWSLCCGLDAVSSYAMTAVPRPDRSGSWIGRYPPVPRMGGKRAYADDTRAILGPTPSSWVMVDADPAIVLWWTAVFDGWLDKVADRIRTYEDDGETLWRRLAYANGKDGKDGPAKVPCEPVELLAAWLVVQKGNFSGKPLTFTGGHFHGLRSMSEAADGWSGWSGILKNGSHGSRKPLSEKNLGLELVAWQNVAGYGHLSDLGREKGFPERVTSEAIAVGVDTWKPRASGVALVVDLDTWEPDPSPGDLVTIDPPYQGTTGYGSKLTRARVVELAEKAHEAGARVLVHEAEPVITGGPWRSVELRKISRKNQDTWRGRSSKKNREVVTINFEPAGRVGGQQSLLHAFTEGR